MEHIHIALVGGQVYPVYLTIAALEPDKVILLNSKQSSAEAERIKAEVRVETELREVDPVNLQLISEKFEALRRAIPDGVQCTVNLTGGTKPWSILLYKAFQDRKDTTFLYVDQNNIIYDFNTLERNPSIPLDMDLLFRLNGNAVKRKVEFEEYTEEDLAEMRKIERLSNGRFSKLFYMFMRDANDDNRYQSMEDSLQIGNSFVDWHRGKDYQSVRIEFVNEKNGYKYPDKEFKSKHAVDLFFNYHWFELKVAEILSKWDKAKKVWMNVEFPYKDNAPKNEIDIIVNTGEKLLFVECKTQIADNTNIDKFNSAVKSYGGMASKALFITYVPMKDKPIEKCEQYRMAHFSLKDNLGKNVNPTMLYGLLNKALPEINKK